MTQKPTPIVVWQLSREFADLLVTASETGCAFHRDWALYSLADCLRFVTEQGADEITRLIVRRLGDLSWPPQRPREGPCGVCAALARA